MRLDVCRLLAGICALTLPCTTLQAEPTIESAAGVATVDRFSGTLSARTRTLSVRTKRLSRLNLRYQVKSLAPGVSVVSRRVSDAKASDAKAPSGRLLVYELRAGKVTTIINDEKRQRREGDFWIVRSSQDIIIEADDDSAVIQIIEISGF
jgi:hypothetical protein